MKINTYLDFRGNEIKLATPEKVTTLPDSNLFVGRTCILISEKEVDETTISVGSAYYYNGEKWCHIEVEPLKIDETKINVIDDEITLRTFDTLSDTKTYINSNNKPKSVIIGSNAGITTIGVSAFADCTSLTSINIPSGVTKIDNNAFYDCTSLKSITIHSGVTSIGNNAFYGCTSLAYITIPSSVTSIGEAAFYNCTSITSVTIPSSVTSIGEAAFSNCTSLTSIAIPNSVTSIGDEAFRNCTSLGSIIIPNNVNITNIGEYTFSGCTSIAYISIPSNITSIGYAAFANCASLGSIIIPNSVTSIGEAAFASCKSLGSITIPSNVTSIGQSAFYMCESLGSVTIPSSVTSIGDAAFASCKSLKSINISSGITSIGEAAFSNCKSLKSITIPSGVTSIANFAFQNCTSLKSITIPSSVTSIGDGAFSGCTSLKSINIPSSVTSIGSAAFYGCDILSLDSYKSRTGYPWGATDILIQNEDVTTTVNENSTDRQVPTAKAVYNTLSPYSLDDTKINVIDDEVIVHKFDTLSSAATYIKSNTKPKSVVIGSNAGITAIGMGAFSNCKSLKSITIPSSVTSINGAFSYCTSLTSITIPDSVTSISGSVFLGCTSLTSITIPDSVTSISDYAFNGCTSLTSITIPSGVTSIDTYAFSHCTSLISIDIPSSVTNIGSGAFHTCESLTSITIPSGITSIGDSTFYGCTSLTSITIPSGVTSIGTRVFEKCTSLKSVTIPDSVTSIGTNTFKNCTSLKSVTIPDSVTSIGANAFYGCDILLLDAYKSRTGYPWGATNIYIQNENVTTTINKSSTDRQVPTAKAVQAPVARLVNAGVKNLLKNTGTSQTINGVTFTVNDDGTVTVNGTSTSNAVFYINILPADTAPNYNGCRLTGCPQGGRTSTYRLSLQLNSGAFTSYASDTGSGSTIHDVPSSDCRVVIVVYSGKTVNNLIFKPMICTAEDYAISSEYVPYAKSNYQLTKDAGPIPKLIDTGAKNLLKNTTLYGDLVRTNITFTHNDDDTYTVNATSANTSSTDLYVAADIPIKAGTYILTGCPEGGNNSNTFKLQIAGIGYDLGDGFTFNIAQDTTISVYIRIWSGYIPNNLVFKPMICAIEDYVISQEFVPYAPSNRELYEEMLPFLSGRKVYEHYFGSSPGSDTFTISKSDFGSSNLSNCGIYLIYRISWGYTPAISIYAFAYSGNRADYTTLQKIAGDDFDISVAKDVLSFTTAGKIQIIAIN